MSTGLEAQGQRPRTLEPPTKPLDATKRWTLNFHTSCGGFVVTLQPDMSPKAAASLVKLAQAGYFDGTIFHRIVPGFVIQGGDPTQSGSGGPGYTTVDTPKAGTRYVTGTVAMAKAGPEPRGAAGSQFFVMTADAPTLPPDYAVVGHVVSGMPSVQRIGKLGDPADPAGAPTQTVVVKSTSPSRPGDRRDRARRRRGDAVRRPEAAAAPRRGTRAPRPSRQSTRSSSSRAPIRSSRVYRIARRHRRALPGLGARARRVAPLRARDPLSRRRGRSHRARRRARPRAGLRRARGRELA